MEIICPYCFKHFEHENVHFKAETAFTEQDMEQESTLIVDSENPFESLMEEMEKGSAAALAETQEVERKRRFEKKTDERYEAFWADFPGSQSDWEYRDHPVLIRNHTDMVKGAFNTDEDGFVNSALDVYDKRTYVRICPFCHNPLPPTYGKYPVRFISTVGITSSGKTVYLSQLIRNFKTIMANADIGCFSLSTEDEENFLARNPVSKGVRLPLGTATESLSRPLFYNVISGDQTYTLVFYDIAGENCVNPRGMDKFGPFIRHANGIIMILDPKQFRRIGGLGNDTASPDAVLNAMYLSFLNAAGTGGRVSVPLVVALSKSDTLIQDPNFSQNSNIFQDVDYFYKPGFHEEEFRNINAEVRRFLMNDKQGKALLTILPKCFEKFGLCSFSAIGCGVKQAETGEKDVYEPVEDPEPKRIEEPLFWLLANEGIIPSYPPRQPKKKGFFSFGKWK